MARPTSRLGIPIALTVAAALVAASLAPARRSFAFEAMLEPLLEAKTARCTVVAQMKGQPAMTFKAMFRGTVDRQESQEMGSVMINDEAAGTSLTLQPKTKTASILQSINRDPNDEHPLGGDRGFLQTMRDQILALRNDKRVTRESLGERKLAGRAVVGYRVTAPGMQFDIWGDPQSGQPHSVVSTMSAFPGVEVTYSNFEFDVELEDSLFSLTPPAGYKVRKDTIDVSKPTEQDFVAALRLYAKANDGAYPDQVNLLEGIKIVGKYRRSLEGMPAEERDAEVNSARKLLVRAFTFPLRIGDGADAGYAGPEVKPGDGDKPLFWYRPAGSEKYRVIRADLKIEDAEQAPEVEGAQRFAQPKKPDAAA